MASFFGGNSRTGGSLTDDIILGILGDGNDSDIEDILDANFNMDHLISEEESESEDTLLPEPEPGPGPGQVSDPPLPPQVRPQATPRSRRQGRRRASEPEPGPSSAQPVSQFTPTIRGQTRGRIWKQTLYVDKIHDYQTVVPVYSVRSPIQYFSDYFDNQFYELGAECTNNYHMRKTGHVLNATPDEIKKVFGMHLYMGLFPFPRMYLFWRQSTRLSVVADVLTRDRFTTLRSALHFVSEDQATSPEDRLNPLWKVQPVITRIKQACHKLERVPGNYSIDEQMIPFTGRCVLRQVVKNKPRPVGLKNFVITTSEGLMLDFDIYLGARTGFTDRDLGIGASVILHLAKAAPAGSCLYFDRYFTSLPLLERLGSLGYHGTGTIMMNRVTERKNLSFKDDTKMKRGESQQFVRDDLALVKWKDNKSVLIASNCTGADNTSLIKRWDKKNKCYIDITCPNVISNYNMNMGGVDILDQQIEYYRAFIKTRKWTLKVIIHFADLAVVNAWRLYRNDCIKSNMPQNKILDLLHFRLEIAEGLTQTPVERHNIDTGDDEDDCAGVSSAKKFKQPTPGCSKRYDNYGHFPYFDDAITSPRTCKLDSCSSRSKIMCTKCKVYLCLSRGKNCFSVYHK